MSDSLVGAEELDQGPAAEPIRVLVPSPLGNLGIEINGRAVSRVVIAPKGADRKLFVPFAKVDDSDFLDEVLGRFSEYFAGARRNLDLEVDFGPCGVSGFARRVLRETTKIPYGRTRTYQRIADAAGKPSAYRQVLATLMSNPLPILVPCHRVVTSKSGVGSYIGGTRRKTWLLRLERQNAERPA